MGTMEKRIAVSTYLTGENDLALYDDLKEIAEERQFEGVLARVVRQALYEFRDRHRRRGKTRTDQG